MESVETDTMLTEDYWKVVDGFAELTTNYKIKQAGAELCQAQYS